MSRMIYALAGSTVSAAIFVVRPEAARRLASWLLSQPSDAYIINCRFIGPVYAEAEGGGRINLINSTIHSPSGLTVNDPRFGSLR